MRTYEVKSVKILSVRSICSGVVTSLKFRLKKKKTFLHRRNMFWVTSWYKYHSFLTVFFLQKFLQKNFLPVQQLKFYFFSRISAHIVDFPHLFSLIYLFIYFGLQSLWSPRQLERGPSGPQGRVSSFTHFFWQIFRLFSSIFWNILNWLNSDFSIQQFHFIFFHAILLIHYFHINFRTRFIFFLL